ncbi:FimV/HubP family polar landmark protein [Burkholderia orbicola]|uniref:FimV/HubP family polar landmark protein n=1 Tax=Burkholderia orbicola TaxID=2978683 RepID=UPI002FE42559
MSRISLFPRQSRLSRAVRGALAILALGAAASAWAVGTGELPASAAGAAAPLTVTVQPGQSLNDIAKAATQSHDPAVLARAGRALFDANPQAFMKRDASRLKVGATLTVPALDATGAALAPAGASAASGAAAASAPAAASGGAAIAQHGASAPHPGSAVHPAPVAPAVHAAPVSGASVATATAAGALASSGASASVGASAAYGASAIESTQPAASTAGASGPHVWSGAIQSAPSSASEAVGQAVPGSPVSGVHEPAGAAPAVSASQPRPSSLQQLLALKNRVLMELQKHGIGKPATTTGVEPAPAPVAPRPATNDAGASAAASTADEAASGLAASAPQPASVSVQPVAPVATPARRTEQMDWRPVAVAGAAVIVLAAGFAWRKRRKGRRADDAGTVATAAAGGGAAAAEAEAEAASSVERELPITPEMPVARDAASDLNLAAATAAAAETIEPPAADTSPAPEVTAPRDESPESPPAHAAGPVASEATPVPVEAPHDAERAEKATAADKPAESADLTAASAAPATTEAQHATLMQNAISALNSLDMPLPPRATDEPSLTAEEPSARAVQSDVDKIATNGQSAQHPPTGARESVPEHPADQDDQDEEFDWDPDVTPPAGQAGSPPVTTSLPPLGGAQFGVLKLDFDLDLPSTPGAALPALTADELARIARNKLDLAAEYVELGDLSGARTLLQEVVDANDAATRDDARALLAKLADEA